MAKKGAAVPPSAPTPDEPDGTDTGPVPAEASGQAVLCTRDGVPLVTIAVERAFSVFHEGRRYDHTDTDQQGRWIYRQA